MINGGIVLGFLHCIRVDSVADISEECSPSSLVQKCIGIEDV
jgi:hypothetical protein